MNSFVMSLTVFDDGTGPALYAAGDFTMAGGVSANHIAKWNGSVWSPLGSGTNFGVEVLTVFDDGPGPALYAGGVFTTAGGVSANRIAKWNGSAWSALGSGMNSHVFALTVFDDGTGPGLYAGGDFISAGGKTSRRIAAWRLDCNDNGIADLCDLTCAAPGGFCSTVPGCGQSHDCNLNGVPDACELSGNDCNFDGRPDECGVFFSCGAFETQKIFAPDAAEGDQFGFAASVGGDVAVVGAYYHACAAGRDCGSAYVYRLTGATWVFEAELAASDAGLGDQFGYSVSADDDVAIVGAPGARCALGDVCGAAYVYRRIGTTWIEEAKFTASEPEEYASFGVSVSVDGNVAVVGAGGGVANAAYVFRRTGTTWVQEVRLAGTPRTGFGYSVSVSGGTIVAGSAGTGCSAAALDCGSAHVYRWDGAGWISEGTLTASDAVGGESFGVSVSVSGDAVVVGAFGDDCAVGSHCGSAYVYRRTGSTWVEEAKLTASDSATEDSFGASVSVSGDVILVGAASVDCAAGLNCGAAYVYRLFGGAWVQQAKLTASDAESPDALGVSVSISGNVALAGARGNRCAGGFTCGAAYVFDLTDPPTDFDCNCNGFSDICDIANGTPDVNGNGIPDECDCPIASRPVGEGILNAFDVTVPSAKSRFLSFSGGDAGASQAVRVKFVTLPGAFSVFNDTFAWVGLPEAVSELPGKGTAEPVGGEATFLAARLSPTLVYADWNAFGVVHVFDERIIPSRKRSSLPFEPAVYEIQLVGGGLCDLNSESSFSPALSITNARWADIAQLADGQFRAPDGVVAIDDALALLAKFTGAAGAPIKARAELLGVGSGGPVGVVDGKIDISDMIAVLNAFGGAEYPFAPQ